MARPSAGDNPHGVAARTYTLVAFAIAPAGKLVLCASLECGLERPLPEPHAAWLSGAQISKRVHPKRDLLPPSDSGDVEILGTAEHKDLA